MTPRIVCFGEMLARLSAPRGEAMLQTPVLSAHIGGAEANVAVCIAHLGGSAAMATILPDNAIGEAARDHLRRHGVDVSAIRFAPGRMGLYFHTPGAVLRPSDILYDREHSAFARAGADAIDWSSALAGAGWLHVSGITPAVSPQGAAAALAAISAATRSGVKVSFDGNYRAKLWALRGETGAGVLRDMLSAASVAFIDERDLSLILARPFASRADAAAAAFEAFPKLDLIAATTRETFSAEDYALGANLFTRKGVQVIDPIAMPGVVDRIGGGDAFAGGFLHALTTGTDPAEALALALYTSIAKHGQAGDACLASEADIRTMMTTRSLDIRR